MFSYIDSPILQKAKLYLSEEVKTLANLIDVSSMDLSQALQGLGDLGLLNLRLPQSWGGKGLEEKIFSDFQELVASYSGALAFLQTQHHSAVGMISASENYQLQEKYLPLIGKNQRWLGVGFSQLRRKGKPTITALPVSGGYQLDGFVPWITGHGIFSDFIVAATLPDGSAVFGVVPFGEINQPSTGEMVRFSPPAQLAAMTSTNTVSSNFSSYFLSAEQVVFIKPEGWIHENDKKNALRTSFLVTGCAIAGLDIIATASKQKSLPVIADALTYLYQELTDCRIAIREAEQNPQTELSRKLHLRSWAIELANRIAQAAVTVSSGAANYRHHSAQRIYRETLLFTVTGQTTEVMAATLARLVRREWRSEEQRVLWSEKKQIIN